MNSCSKEHQKIYKNWFNFADSDGDGRITKNDATKFFAMSNLSRPKLKQVWALADFKRQGFLGIEEFITVMKLVSLAQAGHELTLDLLKTMVDLEPLKPPIMEGLDVLLAKTNGSTTNGELEVNGNSKLQPLPPVNLFT